MNEDRQSGVASDPAVLSLASEEIAVEKRAVVTGRTLVRVVTDTVEDQVQVAIGSEEAEIIHVPVGRVIGAGEAVPQARSEDGTLIVPVFEEIVVIEKRLLLKKEIHIRRRPTTEVIKRPMTLRRQRVVVERFDGTGNAIDDPDPPQPMEAKMTRTVTAFFDDRDDAMKAVEQLMAAGIDRGDIRVLPEAGSQPAETATGGAYDIERDEKGFWASLADFFFPDEDRYSYAEAMHRGSVMVSATVDDATASSAEDVLEEHGTVDMNQREASWRGEGWTGYGGIGAGSLATRSASAEREGVIPLAEEEMRVGKRDVNQGRVKVRSYVVETPVSEDVTLRRESVHVERRPVDRAAAGEDADSLFRERAIEVEERGEEAVIDKQTRIREEVSVGKTVEERTETVSDTVRHTEIEVEDERTDGTGGRHRKAG